MNSILKNPVLAGFNPDPSVCRCGDDYYLAVSSFEWYPGVPVYHSKDLKNWRLANYCVWDEAALDLRGLAASRGVWAPCLSYCEADKLFYLAFTVMYSIRGASFDMDNFITSAPSIDGPWSKPVYVHSAGFDPSLFHDDDGKKYIVSLEWETRPNHYMPGEACMVEYDAKNEKIVGDIKRIHRGSTQRGWIEGPHLYKRNGWYYLLTAEGGTSYNHCVAIARSENVWGPYIPYENNPIITSKENITPDTFENWNDVDSPNRDTIPAKGVAIQRAGHGSLVETSLGELYAFHLCSRPFLPEIRSVLGRETSIQKMMWTSDGWPCMADGGRIAREMVEGSALPTVQWPGEPARDDFNEHVLGIRYISPRTDYRGFTELMARAGYLRLRGQESLCSRNRTSLLAHKLTAFEAELTVKMSFTSQRYSQYAGVCVYYDEGNYFALRKIYDEENDRQVLDLLQAECCENSEPLHEKIPVNDEDVQLKIRVKGRSLTFWWAYDGFDFKQVGDTYDMLKYADEYGKCGDCTGTAMGIFCVDALTHSHCADFDWFEYVAGSQD